ncbi:uncharacterized protein FOBCDRAFT_234109 [Fusarium oxysporum Fo47]|uniref:uncharacterized protein n=1 Tax=Fusarium oxysporum Fo47 TaxID=660027 RepID=UPI002869BA87|nr:uncharacterized protein FOBCDRAFT_234109 [Fusarium oxysporum Fo47]WJG37249.1 hypothetical protein FOBCDRAFT_234109 [Fusarium oxysporum Fo47]
MPEQQQQGRQQNTNLLIHDMFRGGDDTTVHWEPTSHPVAVAWPVKCLVSREAKRHCITQQDVNNLVDFDSLEYAGEIKDRLVCPICIGIFVTPIMTPCGHLFCLECIQKHHRTRQRCPLDRRRLQANRIRLAKGVMDEVGGLHVLCPNSKLGCTCEMRRDCLVQHLLSCYYTANTIPARSKSQINTVVP